MLACFFARLAWDDLNVKVTANYRIFVIKY